MTFSPLKELGLFASSAGVLGTLWTVGWIPTPPGPASLPEPASLSEPAHLSGAARLAVTRPDTVVSFADDILPILRERCAECHGGKDESGGVITEAYLDLLSYESIMAGSEYGSVIEPGDPVASALVDMITSGEMPEEGDLVPMEEIELIRAWVEAGAPDN